MHQYSSKTVYKSGFHVFLPLIQIKYPEVLFPAEQLPSISSFLTNIIILRSHELEEICSRFKWSFSDLSLAQTVLGLYFEEFDMIETSHEATKSSNCAKKFFYYIYLYLRGIIKPFQYLIIDLYRWNRKLR